MVQDKSPIYVVEQVVLTTVQLTVQMTFQKRVLPVRASSLLSPFVWDPGLPFRLL